MENPMSDPRVPVYRNRPVNYYTDDRFESTPFQHRDRFSRVVANNINMLRTLNGQAPADNRTQGLTMPSSLVPSPRPLVSGGELMRTLTPEQIMARSLGAGNSWVPGVNPNIPASGEDARRLTPEQQWRRNAGAGSSMTDETLSSVTDFMAEWYRMSPAERMSAYTGAGAVQNAEANSRALTSGDKVLVEKDGKIVLEDAPDMLTEDQKAKAAGVGGSDSTWSNQAQSRVALNLTLRRKYGSTAADPSRDPDTVMRWLADEHPAIAEQVALAGLSKTDMADVARVLRVKEVAEDAVALVQSGMVGSDTAARQLIATLPTETDRTIAVAFLEDIWTQASESAAEAADRGDSWFSIAGRMLWGISAGPILNALVLANDSAVQYATAGINAFTESADKLGEGDIAGGLGGAALQMVAPVSVFFNGQYDQATRGNLNTQELQEVSDHYADRAAAAGLSPEQGRRAVEIAAEVYSATQTHDSDILDAVLDKYRDDPFAWGIIQQGMTNSQLGDGEWFSDLYTEVSYTDMGNLGSRVTSNLQMDPTWTITTATRDITNITAMIALDPTLAAGRITGAVRQARWGLHNLSGTTNIEKAFTRSGTQNWFNWYGQEVKAIDELHAAGKTAEAGARTTTLLSQSKRYANAETLRLFRKHKVYTADEARDLLQGLEKVEAIITGRPTDVVRSTKATAKAGPRKGRRAKNVSLRKNEYEVSGYRYAEGDEFAKDSLAARESIIQSQSAKRAGQMMIPHQAITTTYAKRFTRELRLGADMTRLTARSTPVMDEILGDDWTALTRAQQTERLAIVMSDDALVDRLALELGDLARTAEGSGQRTLAGRLVDVLVKDPDKRQRLGLNRSGWRRKNLTTGEGALKSMGLAMDRLSRHWSRMPDTRGGLYTADARDADKVYQLMRYAGVNRPAASEFRDAWISMSQAERELASVGFFRTFAKASGMDLVDEDQFAALLKVGSGGSSREGETYAAATVDRWAGAMRDADYEARIAYKAAKEVSEANNVPVRPFSEFKAEARAAKMDELAVTDPAVRKIGENGETRGAVWLSQTSDRVAMPNFAAFDQYQARRSFLNALLWNNKAGQKITDMWTFGTLLGPRFQLRNGLEDVVMYGMSGGKFGSYAEGRRLSTVVRESTGRYDKHLHRAKADVDIAQRNLDQLAKNEATPAAIESAQNALQGAQKRLADVEKMGLKSEKLGFLNKFRLGLATWAGLGAREGSYRAKFAASLWSNFTTPAERLAAVKAGREAVLELQKRAIARERLLLVKDPDARAIPWRLKRGANIEDLSPRQQQILRDMDDFLDSPHAVEYETMASETARHLADGVMPDSLDDLAPIFKATDPATGQKVWMRRTFVDQGYESQKVTGSGATVDQAEGMLFSVNAIISDGPRGQAVLSRLERYWNAMNRAGSPDKAEMGRLVDEVVSYVQSHPYWHVYRERFRLMTPEDTREFVETAFRVASDTFTTPGAKFNRKLWSAIDGRVSLSKADGEFRLLDDAGELIASKEDFLPGGKFQPSYKVVVRKSESIALQSDRKGVMETGWAAMGRSLARMTREPIFKANMLETRAAFRPLEKAYAARWGEEAARKWAADAAAERSYALTMAYTDNPAVRSILAYRVRNIARFYRAVEDFGRRMYRMGRNNPMGFWRAALLWNATVDSGFTYTDEYGQEYFLYPLARPGMEALSRISQVAFGGDVRFAAFPGTVGGQVQWLSPSADPDQWMPTFASPIASVLYRPLLRSVPALTRLFGADDETYASWKSTFDGIDRGAFGAIGASKQIDTPVDGPIGEMIAGVPQALPPILNKLFLGVAPLALGIDSPGSYAAKLAIKSALILEASGQGLALEDSMDDLKVAEYTERIERVALGAAFGMILFGMALPAAPQLMDDQITALGRDLEVTGMRTAFIKLLNKEMEGDGDYWTALEKWTRKNPDMAIFTLSQKEAYEYGFVQGLEGNAEFAQKYSTLFAEAPEALAMFAPNTGEDTLTSRRILNMFDVRTDRALDDYAYELAGRSVTMQYYLDKRRYESDMATAQSDEERKRYTTAWENASRKWKLNHKGLDTHLKDFELSATEEWALQVEKLRGVAQQIGTDGNGLGPDFLELYNDYWAPAKADIEAATESNTLDEVKPVAKQIWESAVVRYLKKHPGDEQWSDLLETMTRGLEAQWALAEG